MGLEGYARGNVARVLHPHRVVRIEQQHRQQIEGLLRAGDDHHLLGTAVDATGVEHVLGDGPAQVQ
ncbi:hypothetical protein D3C81_2335500 [compost metagenome]